jgi:tRNA modification GTPase
VALDFADEDVPELTSTELAHELANVRREMEALVASFERGRLRYQGARVALVGRPNVGKSSLLNAMAGRDRALVTPIAGTTRDVVEVWIVIGGAPVVLMDTAGIRDADDIVESMGVERTRRAVEDAACVVAVFDGSSSLADEDALVAESVKGKPTVIALNKADLPSRLGRDRIEALLGPLPIIDVSALTGTGVGDLSTRLGELLFGSREDALDDEIVLFRARHRDAARKAIADLSRAEDALESDAPLELAASDLAAAATSLAEITGSITSEDVLDRVFADFCLGK